MQTLPPYSKIENYPALSFCKLANLWPGKLVLEYFHHQWQTSWAVTTFQAMQVNWTVLWVVLWKRYLKSLLKYLDLSSRCSSSVISKWYHLHIVVTAYYNLHSLCHLIIGFLPHEYVSLFPCTWHFLRDWVLCWVLMADDKVEGVLGCPGPVSVLGRTSISGPVWENGFSVLVPSPQDSKLLSYTCGWYFSRDSSPSVSCASEHLNSKDAHGCFNFFSIIF